MGKAGKTILAVAVTAVLAGCSSGDGTPAPATRTTSSASTRLAGEPATGAAPAVATTRRVARPNIVFVLTDDLSMNLLPYLPHVRQLQRTGTTLSKYYVVDSLCCPSRTSILTGRYPHNTGIFTNHGADGGYYTFQRNGLARQTYAVSLHRNGYRTGFYGKYLNEYQPSEPVPPGWDDWHVGGNAYREFDYDLNENGRIVHYGSQPRDYLTDVLARRASAFIRSSRQPFALQVSTFSPHSPYTPAPRHAGTAKSLPYPRTPAYDTTPSAAPSWLTGHALTTAQRNRLLRVWRKRVEAVRSVDDLIGTLQRTLAATGKAKDTYVVFSSDNGYHLGEYKLRAGKQTAFDTDIHVPLVVAGPGVARGHVSDQLASNIDLAPTFEALTGSRRGTQVDGVDLTPLLRGERPRSWQRSVLVEHHGPNDSPGDPDRQSAAQANPPDYRAVRTADALYVEYGTGEREYYDTRTDPYQLRNRAAAGVPPALRTTLRALATCSGTVSCRRAAG